MATIIGAVSITMGILVLMVGLPILTKAIEKAQK